MASFSSILSDVGKALKKIFTLGTEAATAAEPFIEILYPGISPLWNTVTKAVISAEGLAITAGAQNGTGPQKLANVVESVTSSFNSFTAANGLATMTQAEIEAAVTAAVAFLNAIPAKTGS
jgi:hypothetical protein